MDIIGAGLSGLIAAHIWPNARLYEIASGPQAQHKALLRFRSDVVAQTTGIEFKHVKVRKGIWDTDVGAFIKPDIRVANQYCIKCLGSIQPERSIWNIEPVERFIAPENFYEQLIDNCGHRIEWGVDADMATFAMSTQPIISTIPLPALLIKLDHIGKATIQFNRSPITVHRFRIPGCEAYQTIYYPTSFHSIYRASITGSLLIVEHVGAPYGHGLSDVLASLGLPIGTMLEDLGGVAQEYGKIVPIEDSMRKRILFDITHEHNIYSLGRFATWRNILLDDIIHDAAVIKRLINSSHHYDLAKELMR